MIYERFSEEIILSDFVSNNCIENVTITDNFISSFRVDRKQIRNLELVSSTIDDSEFLHTGLEGFSADRVSMRNSVYSGTSKFNAVLTNCNIIKSSYKDSVISQSLFTDCESHNLSFENTRIYKTVFSGCGMTGIKIRNSLFFGAKFIPGIDAGYTGMSKSVFSNVYMMNTSFRDMNLSDVKFENSKFIKCDFTNANFDGAIFYNTVFIGCALGNSGKKNIK